MTDKQCTWWVVFLATFMITNIVFDVVSDTPPPTPDECMLEVISLNAASITRDAITGELVVHVRIDLEDYR